MIEKLFEFLRQHRAPRYVHELTPEQKMFYRALHDGETGHQDIRYERDQRVIQR